MSYNIKNFSQTITYTVNDSTANTNAVSLTLLGKSLPNYGTYFNQNFVWLMENFSSDSANPPPYAVQGQLWWDSTYKFMNVYDGSAWKTIYGNLATLNVNGAVNSSSITSTSIAANAITANSLVTTWNVGIGGTPANYGAGYTDLWIDGTSVSQIDLARSGVLKASFVANSGGVYFGTTGIAAASLNIMTATGAYLTQNQFTFNTSGDLISTNGGEFIGYHTGPIGANTPNTVVATSVTTSSGGQHIGYLTGALGANTPNTVVATSVTTSSGGQHIGYHTGALGANTPNTVVATSVTTSSGGQITGYHTGAIGANTANTGVFTTVTTTSGGQHIGYLTGAIGANTANTGAFTTITSTSNITPTGNNTANLGAVSTLYANVHGTNYYVANSIIPISNVTVDIGTPQATFDAVYATSFFGTSTTAKYADLAEKYLPDSNYEIGTVMMVGGSAEVTQHDGRKVRAIGVISEYPAYKMNDGQVGGVYVALKGRVPVKVIGPVEKGQALIGTAHGLAVAQTDDSHWMFGIALENHNSMTIKLIEAVIL
ncbi:hypothetical protein EB001_00655 [bacterium]|nr:hypothetical protein [bacterium]